MKALKSKLAIELLADSTTRGQLREFLATKRSKSLGQLVDRPVSDGAFEIRRGSNAATVLVSVVPKAAKAA